MTMTANEVSEDPEDPEDLFDTALGAMMRLADLPECRGRRVQEALRRAAGDLGIAHAYSEVRYREAGDD